MALRRHLAVSLLAAACVGSLSIAHAGELATAGVPDAQQVYGRAGGTIGSARVATLNVIRQPVTVTYDRETAARTNMASDRVHSGRVGVTWDREVAARTNMPRDGEHPVFANTPPGRS